MEETRHFWYVAKGSQRLQILSVAELTYYLILLQRVHIKPLQNIVFACTIMLKQNLIKVFSFNICLGVEQTWILKLLCFEQVWYLG